MQPLRVLICSAPAAGHVNPATPIARILVERGHEVHWYTGREYRATVESTGAVFEPIISAHDPADGSFESRFPERGPLTGLAALKFDLEHLFLDEAPGQVSDVQRILNRFPAHVLLIDTAFTAASMLRELGGPPYATYGISILPIPSRDLPPIGSGRAPGTSSLARWKDRAITPIATRVIFHGIQRHHQAVRAEVGLGRTRATVFDTFVSPYLYLHGSPASFEYPRRDLPPQVHFVGPLLPEPPATAERPAWADHIDGTKPVVLVTQGTVATDIGDLVAPAVSALADEDVVVIATTAGHPLDKMIEIPSNTHAEAYVPFASLLPHVDVMVTNGGYGGVLLALTHGVPLVVAGDTEEKPEVAARVAWSGAGINLATNRPSAASVRDAVRTVLADDRYRGNARRIRDDAAALDAPVSAADLVEALGRTGQPVRRGETGAGRAQPSFMSDTDAPGTAVR